MSKNVWLKRKRKNEIKKIVQDAISKHKTKEVKKDNTELYQYCAATYTCPLTGVTHRYPVVDKYMWVWNQSWIPIPASFTVEECNGS